jgi:hypothetical protein
MKPTDIAPTASPGKDRLLASSPEDLFKLITEEIRDITEVEKVQGWTPWLILASLASASWIVIQDIWTGGYSRPCAIGVFLFVAIGLQQARFVKNVLEPSDSRGRRTFFFLQGDTSALSVLMSIVWAGSISITSYAFRMYGNQLILEGVAILHALAMFFGCITMTIIVLRLPVPIGRPNRPVLFVLIFMAVTGLNVAALRSIMSSSVMAALKLTDIRVGSLLALSAFGLTVLSGLPSHTTLRKTLIEIRRELVLGEIPFEEAAHQIRIALQGMWLSDIVRDDLRTLLRLIGLVRGEHEDALGRIAALRESGSIDFASRPNPDAMIALALGNLLDALKGHEARVVAVSNKYYALLENVRRRLTFVTQSHHLGSEDFDALVTEIQRAQAPVDALLSKFVAEYSELQEIWNTWFPDHQRHYKPFDGELREFKLASAQ